MLSFLRENVSTILVGVVVFGTLAIVLARVVLNIRRGKSPCGCTCGCAGNCPSGNHQGTAR
ncbi:MAG: FeoB-associated Cys-rich membrane protein [Treponema sp.]|nr:FeoB-associated Cys-rich membrane protein [Treponema sp.]